MNQLFKICLAVSIVLALATACRKDENGSLSTTPYGLGGDTWAKNNIVGMPGSWSLIKPWYHRIRQK
jgi:hypothetical protein